MQESWLGSGPGMGPLSVCVRPSSFKRDCDRRTTSTGERCLVNVHAKSRLTQEPLRTLRPEDKGQAGPCPDRTRAIPCTIQAVTRPGRRDCCQTCCYDLGQRLPRTTASGISAQRTDRAAASGDDDIEALVLMLGPTRTM